MNKFSNPNPPNNGNNQNTNLPPLPPSFEWEDRVIHQLTETAVSLERLRWILQFASLPSPHFDPLLARKAVDVQRLIGREYSLFQLYKTEFDIRQDKKLDPQDLIPFDHYIALKQHTILKISKLDDLLHLHRWLTVALETSNQSVFRTESSPHATVLLPLPPASQIESRLQNMVDYLKRPKYPHPLVKIAFSYYQLTALQPFAIANTDFALLLIDKLLIRSNQFPLPFLNLASLFHTRKNRYQESLLACREQADFNAWLGFFLECVEQAALDTTALITKRFNHLIELNKNMNALFGAKIGEFLAAFCLRVPAFSPAHLEQYMRFSPSFTASVIERLQSAGIVSQFPEGKGYYLPDVIEFWDTTGTDKADEK